MVSSPLPLSSLRLLVPPLRLMSAAMWKVARRQSIRHYGMLEDFVALVTEVVPHILSDRQRGLLLLALRAKMTQEVFGLDPEPQAIQQHLDRINCVALTTLEDQSLAESTANMVSLTQRLVDNPADREHLLQEVCFDSDFDAALQSLICDFLSRLDQLFPVPGFKQAAWWLDAAPGGMEECLQEAESRNEELRALLASHSCQQGDLTTSVGSFAEELLLSSLSRPSRATQPANPRPAVDTAVHSEPVPDWVSHTHLVREEVVETECKRELGEEAAGLKDQPDVEDGGGGATEQEEQVIQGEKTMTGQSSKQTSCPPQKKTEDETSRTETQAQLALCELDRSGGSPVYQPERQAADQSDELCSEATPASDSEAAALAGISHNAQRVAHKCPQCGKCFIYRSQVIRHLRTHRPRGGASHPCPECGKFFRSVRALTEHQCLCTGGGASPGGAGTHQDPAPRPHSCFQCGRAFSSKTELASHVRCHRARPLHQCAKCGRSFRLLSSLSNHSHTHAQTGGYRCTKCDCVFGTARERHAHRQTHRGAALPCPSCSQTFPTQAKLLRHQQLSHPPGPGQDNFFKCRFCDLTFTGLTQLRIHQHTHVLKTYKCEQCQKAFATLRNLQSHKSTHSGERPYLCTHCGKRFRTKDGLEGHQRIHTGERPYCCSYCGKAFTALAGLTVHVRRHTGERPYVCEVCGKGWPSGGDLQKHMRCHTGERPYVCQECGKAFSISCHLTEHMRSHTGEKPYTCPVCEKSLRRKFDLKKHMLSHSDVRPYPCSFCDKSYTRRTHLNRHLQTHMTSVQA